MPRIQLQHQGKTFELQLLPQQTTKQFIQDYIKKNWCLNFDDYHLTYKDSDGDQITVDIQQDFQVAKQTMIEKHSDNLVFTLKLNEGAIAVILDNCSNSGNLSQLPKQAQVQIDAPQLQKVEQVQNTQLAQNNCQQIKVQTIQTKTDQNQELQKDKIAKQEKKKQEQQAQLLLKKAKQQQKQKQKREKQQAKLKAKLQAQRLRKQAQQLKLAKKKEAEQKQKKEAEQKLAAKKKLLQQRALEAQKKAKQKKVSQPKEKKQAQQVKKQVQVKDQRNSSLQAEKAVKSTQKKQKKQVQIPKKVQQLKLTQQKLKQLVRKQILSMIPELKERILYQPVKVIQQKSKLNLQNKNQCKICDQELKVPFYYNTEIKQYLCSTCQSKYQGNACLLKIRNQAHFQECVYLYGGQLKKHEINMGIENYQKFLEQARVTVINKVKQDFKLKNQQYKKKLNQQKKRLQQQKKKIEKQKKKQQQKQKANEQKVEEKKQVHSSVQK